MPHNKIHILKNLNRKYAHLLSPLPSINTYNSPTKHLHQNPSNIPLTINIPIKVYLRFKDTFPWLRPHLQLQMCCLTTCKPRNTLTCTLTTLAKPIPHDYINGDCPQSSTSLAILQTKQANTMYIPLSPSSPYHQYYFIIPPKRIHSSNPTKHLIDNQHTKQISLDIWRCPSLVAHTPPTPITSPSQTCKPCSTIPQTKQPPNPYQVTPPPCPQQDEQYTPTTATLDSNYYKKNEGGGGGQIGLRGPLIGELKKDCFSLILFLPMSSGN